MQFQSKIQQLLIDGVPYFKGSWLIYSNIFRLFPFLRICYIDDLKISLDISDPPQFSIIKIRHGIIEVATTKFIKSHLKKGDIFIDVGANWGYYTCLASKIVGEDGLIISIEPFRNTFTKLLDTILRNRIFNVIPFNNAAGEKFGELAGFVKPWYEQSTSAYLTKGGEVSTITLDWLIEKIKFTSSCLRIIKIDVEGAELLVLKGAANILFKHRPFVIVETGGYHQRFGHDVDDIFVFMDSLGYTPLYILDDDGDGEIKDYIKKNRTSAQIVFGNK